MPAPARERLDSLVRQMRQRQEQEAQARRAWAKALPRCKVIAQDLAAILAGVEVRIEARDGQLTVELPNGARATYAFEAQGLALVGRRAAAGSEPDAAGDVYWTLPIRPPAQPATNVVGGWGPSPVEGVRALTAQADSQQAYETALADFFEWGLTGNGTDGEHVRIP